VNDAPVSSFRRAIAALQQGRLDRRGLAGQCRALVDADLRLVQPCFEIGDGRRDLRLALLQHGRGEERFVDFLPQAVRRGADAGLGFGESRALDGDARLPRRIEERLFEANVSVERIFRRLRCGASRNAQRNLDDLRLILRLSLDAENGTAALELDRAQAQLGLLGFEPQLRDARVGRGCELVGLCELDALLRVRGDRSDE
jgi:hypothetical protein